MYEAIWLFLDDEIMEMVWKICTASTINVA